MKNELVFNKSVKNKQVAFVGMAPNIRGKGLGSEIDAFDVVIRTNIFPIPVELQQDYGKKCDILALHVNNTHKDYNVKTIITYKEREGSILITKDDRLLVSDAVKKVVGKDPIYGTNGINMMYFCLEAGCSRFKFYGITGYQNKKGQIMNHDEVSHYITKDEDRERKAMRENPHHKFQVLNDYLRYMLKQGKIEMDKHSKKYFI